MDMHSSNFLGKKIRMKYLRYARVGMLMMKQRDIPLYVEILSVREDSSASLCVTHLDDFRAAAKSSEVAVMVVQAAYHYLNSPKKSLAFNYAFLYKAGILFLGPVREIYDTLDRGDVTTFVLLIDTSLQVTPSISRTVSHRFRSTLRLVESASDDERSQTSRRAVKRFRAFVGRVKSHLFPVNRRRLGAVTANVVQVVRWDTQEGHRCKRQCRENTEVSSVRLDSLSVSSSE